MLVICEDPQRKETLRKRLSELRPAVQESSVFWLTDHPQLNLDHPQYLFFNEVWTTAIGEQRSIFAPQLSQVELEDELSDSLQQQ